MRVALVHFIPDAKEKNYLAFNHGLASISAVLKRDGHETRLFQVANGDMERASKIAEYDPAVVFVYLTTNQFSLFIHTVESVFSKMDVSLIVGGPHATCMPEDTVSINGVSGVCVGDGEDTAGQVLVRLGQGEQLDGIDNLWVYRGGEAVPPAKMTRVQDLDELPFPDRSIFPYESLLHTREMDILGMEFFFSRGCNYTCSFCMNSKKQVFDDSCGRIRRRSVSSVVDEIASVIDTYDYKGVLGFQDDVFSSSLAWLEEFAAEYRQRIGLPFWCNAHVDHLDEKRVKALRRAGCFRVQVGVECGDEELRAGVLGKKITSRRIVETFELLKKHHIKTVAYFMIGLPDETEKQIQKSIELCRKIKPDWTLVSTFCPYPGTTIYDQLVAEGRLDPYFYKTIDVDTYYSPVGTYDQRGVSGDRLDYYYSNFVSLAK